MGAHIINLSLQVGGDSGAPDQVIADAVKQAIDAGIIVVAAAGNSGPGEGTMSRIARLPGVISVGAANWEGTSISPFSSRGTADAPQSGPTLVPPGEDVIGPWIQSKPKGADRVLRDSSTITLAALKTQTGKDYSPQALAGIRRTYTVMSGTSQACAYVSGIMARFVELRRTLQLPHTSREAIAFLERAAKPIAGVGGHVQGFGFVSVQTIDTYMKTVLPDDTFWAIA